MRFERLHLIRHLVAVAVSLGLVNAPALDVSALASGGRGGAASMEAGRAADETITYHVRILRARLDPAVAGSALFKTREAVVPLSEHEVWGRAEQAEAVRKALGASDVEVLPGLVLASGPADDGGPHRFKTGLGEAIIEITFEAQSLADEWHRVTLAASDEEGREILNASVRIRTEATTAVAAPIDETGSMAVLAVTPLGSSREAELGDVPQSDSPGITPPELIEKILPEYPEVSRRALVRGEVIIEAVIRKDGRPDRFVVVQMPPGGEWLAGSAVEACSRWRWRPALLSGKPVDVWLRVTVRYELQ